MSDKYPDWKIDERTAWLANQPIPDQIREELIEWHMEGNGIEIDPEEIDKWCEEEDAKTSKQ